MKDSLKKKFKAVLSDMRKATGLTQAALAKKMGTTQEYACRLEGKGPMSLEKAAEFAEACGYKTKVVFREMEGEKFTVVKVSK